VGKNLDDSSLSQALTATVSREKRFGNETKIAVDDEKWQA
jgi:hypothetical protein